jgi:hypothetical protein
MAKRRPKRQDTEAAKARQAWPWDDRGRSALSREQIEKEAHAASMLYSRAMNANRTA